MEGQRVGSRLGEDDEPFRRNGDCHGKPGRLVRLTRLTHRYDTVRIVCQRHRFRFKRFIAQVNEHACPFARLVVAKRAPPRTYMCREGPTNDHGIGPEEFPKEEHVFEILTNALDFLDVGRERPPKRVVHRDRVVPGTDEHGVTVPNQQVDHVVTERLVHGPRERPLGKGVSQRGTVAKRGPPGDVCVGQHTVPVALDGEGEFGVDGAAGLKRFLNTAQRPSVPMPQPTA